jgi:hypothetical protein
MSAEQCIEYRDVVGFPGYRVDSNGIVWTAWKKNGSLPSYISDEWGLLKQTTNKGGYLIVGLYRDGRRFPFAVHRLMLEAFVGPMPEGKVRCHNDGNKLNNSIDNLRYDTPASNYDDAVKHGSLPHGEDQHLSKLTEADVIAIRSNDGMTHREKAAKYGVSRSTISCAIRRTTWKHI